MIRTPAPLLAVTLFAAVLAATPRPAWSAWPSDPTVNLPLCTASGGQQYPTIVSDGAGGTIVTWQDQRSGDKNIYAQKISVDGTLQWTADGVALCTASGDQQYATIISDGAGGAIVTWQDNRGGNFDIYAQRISAAGAVQWTANGAALCTATREQSYPTIVSDGALGAIVTWQDQRDGSNNHWDIYAQRISAGGTAQWTANGVALCTATGNQYSPTLVSDGANGAIVAWQDDRIGNSDIYAQRISAGGTAWWTANGVALCTATGTQDPPTLTSDNAGGAVVTWGDNRIGNSDIYAQRISAAGTVRWTANGAALCTAIGAQSSPTIVSDSAGGAIVTWYDQRSGSNDGIYTQRISAGGTVSWAADGVALCTATGTQYSPTIASDNAGGAIVTWRDDRIGNSDIYGQRISADGTVQWTANGAALCIAIGTQSSPAIVSDGMGGAIVTWQDQRGGSSDDIYAQQINSAGLTGFDYTITASVGPQGTITPSGAVGVNKHGSQGFTISPDLSYDIDSLYVDGASVPPVPSYTFSDVQANHTIAATFAAACNAPPVNVPLCIVYQDQEAPAIAPDGEGGAIVVWQDFRNGSHFNIYAQRLSAGGVPQWPGNGVGLCYASGNQDFPSIVSDNSGGAIVTWTDLRSVTRYEVYAQRISANGIVQWTADGVALCTDPHLQETPAIVSDGAGGAIIAWRDSRGDPSDPYDIYAQRISADGTLQWTANGVAVCTAAWIQQFPEIVSDGLGGAIVAWADSRGVNNAIYAQRISADGVPQWTANGVAVCAVSSEKAFIRSISDAAGGAIVAWTDDRNYWSTGYDIYAQRISADGTVQWTPTGVALCTASDGQHIHAIASDGAAGAIIAWDDSRNYDTGYTGFDIYAQRVSAAGIAQWTANGVPVCTAAHDQFNPSIASDGASGAIVAWQGDDGIGAQRISGTGTVLWTADGVALCNSEETGAQFPQLVSDGAGGAVVAWEDFRGGRYSDIYAQRVQANGGFCSGVTGVSTGTSLAFALDPVRPNPSRGGALTVHFVLSSIAAASLELFDVAGRRIVSRDVGSLGPGQHTMNLAEGRRLAPGFYLVRLRQGANARVTRAVVLK